MRRHLRARAARGAVLVLVAGLALATLVSTAEAASSGTFGAGAAGASGSPSSGGTGDEVPPVRFEPVAAESVDARHPGSITGTPFGDVVVGLVAVALVAGLAVVVSRRAPRPPRGRPPQLAA
jgi:hypothetical protein